MTPEYEFRSRIVEESGDEYKYNNDYRAIEKTCDAWAAEGFEVFSVLPTKARSDYRMSVRLTAKRRLVTDNELRHKTTGRRFR